MPGRRTGRAADEEDEGPRATALVFAGVCVEEGDQCVFWNPIKQTGHPTCPVVF